MADLDDDRGWEKRWVKHFTVGDLVWFYPVMLEGDEHRRVKCRVVRGARRVGSSICYQLRPVDGGPVVDAAAQLAMERVHDDDGDDGPRRRLRRAFDEWKKVVEVRNTYLGEARDG